MKPIRITDYKLNFEREKLVRPFGFRGGYLTELWQTAAGLKSASGHFQVGLATQSTLYCDQELFARQPEASGNAMMYLVTNAALQFAQDIDFHTPLDLMHQILPALKAEAVKITGKDNLNLNFIHNALVGPDLAAWLLFARENGIKDFYHLIPLPYREAFSCRHQKVAVVYQVPYGMPVSDIVNAVRAGYFVIKIKLGHPGNEEEMLLKDIQRLSDIHHALKDSTAGRKANRIVYTLDANCRYHKMDSVKRLLDHTEKIKMRDQILCFEEPFDSKLEFNVNPLGLCIAADESIQTLGDAKMKLEQGYGAFVIKSIAKSLSLSLEITKLAYDHKIPCLCADLTVNPVLLNWNKIMAAHLPTFPELYHYTLLETNGDMNYANWENMMAYLPDPQATWNKVENGSFNLSDEFYNRSSDIFESSRHYVDLLEKA